MKTLALFALFLTLLCQPGRCARRATTATVAGMSNTGKQPTKYLLPMHKSETTIQEHVLGVINGKSNPNCFRHSHGRDHRGDLTETCDAPEIPNSLFGREPYCRGTSCLKRETCLIVAENLMAYYGTSFDAVFLHADICANSQGLHPGNLTQDTVKRLLPTSETLVGVTLNGTDFLRVLLQGFIPYEDEDGKEDVPSFVEEKRTMSFDTCAKPEVDRYPILAGVKLDLDRNPQDSRSVRIYNVQYLSEQCEWRPVDRSATYNILTTERMALGHLGYSFMAATYGYWNTGQTVREAFWDQVLSTCSVQQPIPHVPFRLNGRNRLQNPFVPEGGHQVPPSQFRRKPDLAINATSMGRWISSGSQ